MTMTAMLMLSKMKIVVLLVMTSVGAVMSSTRSPKRVSGHCWLWRSCHRLRKDSGLATWQSAVGSEDACVAVVVVMVFVEKSCDSVVVLMMTDTVVAAATATHCCF